MPFHRLVTKAVRKIQERTGTAPAVDEGVRNAEKYIHAHVQGLPDGHKALLTDLHYQGDHFNHVMKAAHNLHKKGLIHYDGVHISKPGQHEAHEPMNREQVSHHPGLEKHLHTSLKKFGGKHHGKHETKVGEIVHRYEVPAKHHQEFAAHYNAEVHKQKDTHLGHYSLGTPDKWHEAADIGVPANLIESLKADAKGLSELNEDGGPSNAKKILARAADTGVVSDEEAAKLKADVDAAADKVKESEQDEPGSFLAQVLAAVSVQDDHKPGAVGTVLGEASEAFADIEDVDDLVVENIGPDDHVVHVRYKLRSTPQAKNTVHHLVKAARDHGAHGHDADGYDGHIKLHFKHHDAAKKFTSHASKVAHVHKAMHAKPDESVDFDVSDMLAEDSDNLDHEGNLKPHIIKSIHRLVKSAKKAGLAHAHATHLVSKAYTKSASKNPKIAPALHKAAEYVRNMKEDTVSIVPYDESVAILKIAESRVVLTQDMGAASPRLDILLAQFGGKIAEGGGYEFEEPSKAQSFLNMYMVHGGRGYINVPKSKDNPDGKAGPNENVTEGMNHNLMKALKPGDKVSYNDGRPGHQGVHGHVISNHAHHAVIHFKDRAEPSSISHHDRAWTKHLTHVEHESVEDDAPGSFLNSVMKAVTESDYHILANAVKHAEKAHADASAHMQQYAKHRPSPGAPLPDHVKSTPEYKAHKASLDAAHDHLRRLNQKLVKHPDHKRLRTSLLKKEGVEENHDHAAELHAKAPHHGFEKSKPDHMYHLPKKNGRTVTVMAIHNGAKVSVHHEQKGSIAIPTRSQNHPSVDAAIAHAKAEHAKD